MNTKTDYGMWNEGIEKTTYPKLNSSLETDVAIVGGGLAGVISAYLLSKEGKKVALFEKGNIGDGATGITTAILTEVIDTDPTDLKKIYGGAKAKMIYKSHRSAIKLMEDILKETGGDADFKRVPNFIYINDRDEFQNLYEQKEAFKKNGVDASVYEDGLLGFKNWAYIKIPNQGKFHPMKFLQLVAKKAVEAGAKIFEHSEAGDINAKNVSQDSYVVLKVGDKDVKAKDIIISTYEPYNKPLSLYFKKAFYTTYMFELEAESGKVLEGVYEDMNNPYHYFRVDKGEKTDRIVIGGEDHRSDIKSDHSKNFQALEEYAKKIFEKINFRIVRQWYGPILEPVDGLPYIGPLSDCKNINYAMAFSGNGMTGSAIAASIISDTILGSKNPLSKLYAAKRAPSAKALAVKGKDFTGELFGGAVKNSITYRKSKKFKG